MAAADAVPPTESPAIIGGLRPEIEAYIAGYEHPNIVLVIGRSQNLNVVVYEAMMAGEDLLPGKPIEGYWLNIDPEYVAQKRAKGKTDYREELGIIESSLAYGVRAFPAGVNTYNVSLTAIPGRVFTLCVVDGRPRLQTHIAGKHAYISRAYMEAQEELVSPKVLWVDLFGRDASTGEPLQERVLPS